MMIDAFRRLLRRHGVVLTLFFSLTIPALLASPLLAHATLHDTDEHGSRAGTTGSRAEQPYKPAEETERMTGEAAHGDGLEHAGGPGATQHETAVLSHGGSIPVTEIHQTGDTGAAHESRSHGSDLGRLLPLWSIIPFIGILLSIALFPLAAPHFWHHQFPKISAAWAIIFAVPFLIVFGSEALHEILHIYFIDYIPFIILLWALYTISGGIQVKGAFRGTPAVNTLLLIIGTAIASWVGTTGAAMLLIRPLIRANKDRHRKVHTIVFFIFLTANIGGSLTPLGDPPLFLGFLHGVPFFWTMNLLPHMVFVVVLLLGIYFLMDTYHYRREIRDGLVMAAPAAPEPVRIAGTHNLIFLFGVLASVILSGYWRPGGYSLFGVHMEIQNSVKDGVLILMGLLSLWSTSRSIRKENQFSWFPIKEVAYLFAGIFMTIVPALAILKAGAEGALAPMLGAISRPVHYFWVVGILSSFLDNAPTYLTFLNSALGQFYAGIPEFDAVHRLIAEKNIYLKAISAGAVFMGANTYIGNAPNFMVKSIAEQSGVPMPSFFGYILRYSIPILLPVFIVVSLVFFLSV